MFSKYKGYTWPLVSLDPEIQIASSGLCLFFSTSWLILSSVLVSFLSRLSMWWKYDHLLFLVYVVLIAGITANRERLFLTVLSKVLRKALTGLAQVCPVPTTVTRVWDSLIDPVGAIGW